MSRKAELLALIAEAQNELDLILLDEGNDFEPLDFEDDDEDREWGEMFEDKLDAFAIAGING